MPYEKPEKLWDLPKFSFKSKEKLASLNKI